MNPRLRRVLRPIGRPAKRLFRRLRPPVEEGLWGVARALGRASAIRPMRRHEIAGLVAREPYYKSRGVYLTAAAETARELIARRRLRTALELGPHAHPLIVGADAVELQPTATLAPWAKRIIWHARETPWPFGDKAYDLFVALQVFEHLYGRQPEAFLEVRRIARNAILSLPIEWEMADPRNIHHMISDDQVRAWFAPVEPTRVVVGNGGARKRLIYVFEDLPAP